LTGTWYFAPVSIDGVPLAEAAFLGRASSLSATAARLEVLNTHQSARAASLGYYLPGTMFYAGVGISRLQYRTTDILIEDGTNWTTIVRKEHDTNWSGTLGIAPLDGLLITTNFQEDGYDPNITARYVGKLPNDHFYAGSVSIVDSDWGDTSFGLEFDYYFDESSSLGVGYADRRDRWELRAEKFFAKSWAVGVSASTDDFEDGFGIHVTWRH
jgi:hypothetical protein